MEAHTPYQTVKGQPPDFIVEYLILTEEEGGRKTPPFQGVRWDFWYEHEENKDGWLFVIWPEFLEESGRVITQMDKPVPTSGKAQMWIINDDMRKYHQGKIHVGMKANAHEGPRVVAKYVVTELAGLMTNPAPPLPTEELRQTLQV